MSGYACHGELESQGLGFRVQGVPLPVPLSAFPALLAQCFAEAGHRDANTLNPKPQTLNPKP